MIESAARRLGVTAVVDAFEEKGYHAPSVEEDMAVIGPFSFEEEVACEM